MPRRPVSGPDPSSSDPSSADMQRGQGHGTFETDFAELTRNFAERARELSPELSADLALEIVLNQMVQQACLATGASGAAIALKRGDELVCRASSGMTAPALGSRLGMGQGLSGECIRTRQVHICGDTETDGRADVLASRMLGVRSVIVLPLVRGLDLVGVLEAFSQRAHAFGDRDRHTLETLAQDVLKNVERAANWSPAAAAEVAATARDNGTDFAVDARLRSLAAAARSAEQNDVDDPGVVDSRHVDSRHVDSRHPDSNRLDLNPVASGIDDEGIEEPSIEVVPVIAPSRAVRVATWMLGAVVLISAAGLAMLAFERLAGKGEIRSRVAPSTAPAASGDERTVAQPTSSVQPASPGYSGPGNSGTGNASATKSVNAAAPPGSLVVFEKGREVFRMVPQGDGQAKTEAPNAAHGDAAQGAVSIEPDGVSVSGVKTGQVVELTAAEAEQDLVRRVEPEYPPAARLQGIQGPVVLEVRIAEQGTVQDLQLISGQPLLAQAAIAAVKQWKFKPRMVKGEPVEMQTRVTLNFRLPSDGAR